MIKIKYRKLIEIQGVLLMGYSAVFIGGIISLSHLVLGDHMLRLGKRRSIRLPCIDGCLGSKDILFEEALTNNFFHVLSKAFAVDGPVPLALMVRTILLRSGECGVVVDRLLTLYPQLIFDSIEDFVDGESRRSEVLFHLEGLEWIQ